MCTVLTCSCTRTIPYWSSTSLVGTGSAWSVDFGLGFVEFSAKHSPGWVRAVRGGP